MSDRYQPTSVRGIARDDVAQYRPPSVAMQTELGALTLKGPVLTAAGCAGTGRELDAFFDITAVGAFITPSISLHARAGLPTPRMAETPSGLVHAIGHQGPGVDRFIERDLAWLAQRGTRVIVSIVGATPEEYPKVAQRLRSAGGFDAIEVNLAAANPATPGRQLAQDPEAAASVVQAVRRHGDSRIPVLAKLSSDASDIAEVARAVVRAGADALTLANAPAALDIDVDTMLPALGGVVGALSGPAIRPLALRCVWQVRQALPQVPILGSGGIRNGLDALAFILAGAHAVAVGSTLFRDPSAPVRIHEELARALEERGFSSLQQAISYAHRSVAAVEDITEVEVLTDDPSAARS